MKGHMQFGMTTFEWNAGKCLSTDLGRVETGPVSLRSVNYPDMSWRVVSNDVVKIERMSAAPVEKTTPCNEQGSSIYLDRHNVDCGTGWAISKLRLTPCSGTRMQWKYTCSPILFAGEAQGKSLGRQSSGSGNTVYLDRLNIQCDGGGVLSRFRLTRPSSSDNSFDYTCFVPTAGTKARAATEKATATQTQGDTSKIIFLDRHTMDCGSSGLLGRFQLHRPSGDTISFRYTCVDASASAAHKKVAAAASVFRKVAGLTGAGGKTVSFEQVSNGNFLRHLPGSAKIVSRKNDGTAAFKQAATFVEKPGLSGASGSVSYQAASAEHLYIGHRNYVLQAVVSTDSALHRKDATFKAVADGPKAVSGANAPWACMTAHCPVSPADVKLGGDLMDCRATGQWIELDITCAEELRYRTAADGNVAARGAACRADGGGKPGEAAGKVETRHIAQAKLVEGQGYRDRMQEGRGLGGVPMPGRCNGEGRPGCPQSTTFGDWEGSKEAWDKFKAIEGFE